MDTVRFKGILFIIPLSTEGETKCRPIKLKDINIKPHI